MSTALQKSLFAEQWNSDIKENGFAQAPFAFFMRSLVDQSLPKTINESAKTAADERSMSASLSFSKKTGEKSSLFDFYSFIFSFLNMEKEKSLHLAKKRPAAEEATGDVSGRRRRKRPALWGAGESACRKAKEGGSREEGPLFREGQGRAAPCRRGGGAS